MNRAQLTVLVCLLLLALGGILLFMRMPGGEGAPDVAQPVPQVAHDMGKAPDHEARTIPDSRTANVAVEDPDAGLDEAVVDDSEAGRVESDEEIDFLPYPNNGEEDFAAKYDDLSVGDLFYRMDVLNKKVSAWSMALGKDRLDMGNYVVHEAFSDEDLRNNPEAFKDPFADKPVGAGDVWPVSALVGVDIGAPEMHVTYLTEAEYPELFAQRHELLYALKVYQLKSAQGK